MQGWHSFKFVKLKWVNKGVPKTKVIEFRNKVNKFLDKNKAGKVIKRPY